LFVFVNDPVRTIKINSDAQVRAHLRREYLMISSVPGQLIDDVASSDTKNRLTSIQEECFAVSDPEARTLPCKSNKAASQKTWPIPAQPGRALRS